MDGDRRPGGARRTGRRHRDRRRPGGRARGLPAPLAVGGGTHGGTRPRAERRPARAAGVRRLTGHRGRDRRRRRRRDGDAPAGRRGPAVRLRRRLARPAARATGSCPRGSVRATAGRRRGRRGHGPGSADSAGPARRAPPGRGIAARRAGRVGGTGPGPEAGRTAPRTGRRRHAGHGPRARRGLPARGARSPHGGVRGERGDHPHGGALAPPPPGRGPPDPGGRRGAPAHRFRRAGGGGSERRPCRRHGCGHAAGAGCGATTRRPARAGGGRLRAAAGRPGAGARRRVRPLGGRDRGDRAGCARLVTATAEPRVLARPGRCAGGERRRGPGDRAPRRGPLRNGQPGLPAGQPARGARRRAGHRARPGRYRPRSAAAGRRGPPGPVRRLAGALAGPRRRARVRAAGRGHGMAGRNGGCRPPDASAPCRILDALAVSGHPTARAGRAGRSGRDRLAAAAGGPGLATDGRPRGRVRRRAGRRPRRADRGEGRRVDRRRAGRRGRRPVPGPARDRLVAAGPDVAPGRRPCGRSGRRADRAEGRDRRHRHAGSRRRAGGRVRQPRPSQRRGARGPRARGPAHGGRGGGRGAGPGTGTGHRGRRGERPVDGRPDHAARGADPVHRRPECPGRGADPGLGNRPQRRRAEGSPPRQRGRRSGVPRGQRRPGGARLGRGGQHLRASHASAAVLAGAGRDAGAPDRPRRGPGGRRVGGVVGCGGAGRRCLGGCGSGSSELRNGAAVSAPRDTMQACRPTPWNPPPACAW